VAVGTNSRRAIAASDKFNIALMGVRGRGRSLTSAFCAQPDINVAYVCDVDENVVEDAYKIIEASGRKRPPLVADLRRCLEDKSVDAIVMGTPLHWHAPGTILACQAGKDVYVEKPASHNVREGRLMTEAARRHGRIVQVGSQLPSLPVTQAFHDYVQSGQLGRVLMAKVLNVQLRRNIGHKEDEPVPAGVEYEIWTGPLPKMPFNRNRFHSTVNWHWHYGSGDIGNDGVHELDIARRVLGVQLPTSISGMGRKMYFDDDQQTPDTMNMSFDFDGGKGLIWEMRIWHDYGLEGIDNGVAVYGTDGFPLALCAPAPLDLRCSVVFVGLCVGRRFGLGALVGTQSALPHCLARLEPDRPGRVKELDAVKWQPIALVFRTSRL
jgi:predicted dehydrogenase